MSDKFLWGPTYPHPLSQMRTELVWEGKYDEYGRRREVDVASSGGMRNLIVLNPLSVHYNLAILHLTCFRYNMDYTYCIEPELVTV